MIPILDKEVPKDLLEARTRRALAKGREVMDKGDPLRGRSRLFLEQLRTQVNHRFSLARHRRRHADVVNEDPIPDRYYETWFHRIFGNKDFKFSSQTIDR